MLQNFIVVDASLTGGEIGLTVPDVITISDAKNYEIALWFMAVSGGQDAVQAGALGFNVTKHKLAAFIISAFFSGLAGGMVVFYLGSASVGTLVDITVGVQIIIAAVLGGRRTILGGALGAIFLIAMSEALRPIGDLANFVVFAMALVVVLAFPSGFFGLLTRTKEPG
jgi:branched-chain amino acid transport system permease protein